MRPRPLLRAGITTLVVCLCAFHQSAVAQAPIVQGFVADESTFELIPLATITLVATGVFVGEEGSLRQVARSFEELELSRAAAARLERMGAPEPGERAFAPGVRGAGGRETVRLLEPGLYEVTVEVRRGGHVVRLVTLFATEAPR